jgi:hypothetical protein
MPRGEFTAVDVLIHRKNAQRNVESQNKILLEVCLEKYSTNQFSLKDEAFGSVANDS